MAITLDGTTGTTTPNVVLPGSASGTITLAAPSAAGTQSYTLPTGVPAANGYALTSTTAGVMSWAAAGGSAATPTALGTVYGSMTTSGSSPFLTSAGYNAGAAATGIDNTFFGFESGKTTSTGTDNTAVGHQSIKSNTTGNYNIGVGSLALSANTTGGFNVGMGYGALYVNTTASNNVGVGAYALISNVTGANNTSVGHQALQNNTASNNVAVGYQSLNQNTSGTSNTAFGYAALYANSTASSSTAVGYQTLVANTSGARHTAIGQQALQTNTTGNYCVAAGYQALGLSNGDQNTAVGYIAGSSVSTGGSNCFFGSQAGGNLTTGTNNTILGYNSNASAVGGTFQIVIGSGVNGQGDSYVTLGSNTAKVYNQYSTNATWTQTSDGRLKTNINDDSLGLSFINRLRPVTFTWKASNEIDPSLPYYSETNQRDTTTVIHGLIAQEVKAALDAEGCSTFNGWDAGNEDSIQAISREMFISPLIKAIQELTARVAALEAK